MSVCERSGAPPVLQQKERKDAIVVRTGSIISAARGGRLRVSMLLHFVVAGLLFLRFRPLKTRDRHSTMKRQPVPYAVARPTNDRSASALPESARNPFWVAGGVGVSLLQQGFNTQESFR